MRKRFGKNGWFIIMAGLLLALYGRAANEDQPVRPKEDKSMQIIPDAANHLFQWPSDQVLEAKRVAADIPEVAFPKKQCAEWLHRVIAPSWLPDKEPEPLLIRKESDDCDVVRFRWSKNGYAIEVSQTASIFAMKLTPKDGRSMGKDNKEKLNVARELCLQVFARQGRRWADQGNTIAISNLAQKIASYSFREDTVQNLQADSAVLSGRPRTMKEEGLGKAQDETQSHADNGARSAGWDMTEHAWRYWFRMVHWRNDGISIRMLFPKVEGEDARADAGVGVPDYGGNIDKNWFRLPKDISGRTLPQK